MERFKLNLDRGPNAVVSDLLAADKCEIRPSNSIEPIVAENRKLNRISWQQLNKFLKEKDTLIRKLLDNLNKNKDGK